MSAEDYMPHDWGYYVARAPRPVSRPTCNRCGVRCNWGLFDGVYRLTTGDGVHICSTNMPSPDDFEALA